MNKWFKLFISLNIAIILILSIFTFLYFKDLKEEQYQFDRFTSELHHATEQALYRINLIIEEEPTDKKLTSQLNDLERKLINAHNITEHARSFLNTDIRRAGGFRYASFFLHGINMSGNLSFSMPAMDEDGQLDEDELAILKTINSYLTNAKTEMESPETNQKRADLSVDDINEIILNHLNQYSDRIYLDTFNPNY